MTEADGDSPCDEQGRGSLGRGTLLGPAEMDEAVPGISICPRCGVRLVTKNLWHSCRTFTLDGLFPTVWLESGSPDFRRVRTAFVCQLPGRHTWIHPSAASPRWVSDPTRGERASP